MRKTFTHSALIIAMCLGSDSVMAQAGPAASAPAMLRTVTVENGVATFYVPTNITAIEVSGKSTAGQARVKDRQDGHAMTLQHIEAWMPIKSLNTGMGLRDEHMRKHIFT